MKHLSRKLLMWNLFGAATRHEDVLSGLKTWTDLPRVLPQTTPDAVARHGIADLGGNGEPDLQFPAAQIDQHQIAGGMRDSLAVDIPIIAIPAQSKLSREAEIADLPFLHGLRRSGACGRADDGL